MIRLCVAFVDGTFIDEQFPSHQLDDIELMVAETPDEFLQRVQIENARGELILNYYRKPIYAY